MTKFTEIQDFSAWAKIRAKVEGKIRNTIGPVSEECPDLQIKVIDELDYPGFVRRRINYFVSDWERISAWYFVPEHVEEDAPAILCLHDRTPEGKDEPAGLTGDPHLAFAQHFAEQGYVTLAPDVLTAGERVLSSGAAFDSSTWYHEHPKSCLLGKFVGDHMRALDVLDEARESDGERIGVIGHGLGGMNALFLAALDERVRAVVSSCGFVPFSTNSTTEQWYSDDGLCLIPKIKPALKKGMFPFNWDEILALIAPNPVLVFTALNDEVWAGTETCEEAVDSAAKVYGLLSESKAIRFRSHKEGRRFTFGMLEEADDWFDQWL